MGDVQATAAPVRVHRWPLFLLGVVLCVLGPVSIFILMKMKVLVTPWQAPILGTLGVLLMGLAVRQRPTVWRIIGTGLFVLFCGFEWFMVLVSFRTPAYTGPAQAERKLPAFASTFADGTSFTDKDLAKGTRTALVFNRGRW